MDKSAILTLLAHDLGYIIPASNRTAAQTAIAERLGHLIDVAEAEITKEGHPVDTKAASAEDAQLILMYASWLFRKRETGEGMPRMLRYCLNNAVFHDKTKPEEEEEPETDSSDPEDVGEVEANET